jgi:hypothetical protein
VRLLRGDVRSGRRLDRERRSARAAGAWYLGVGVASAFVAYGADAPPGVVDALAIPATVGELWMIAYLLVIGIRPVPEDPSRIDTQAGPRHHRSPQEALPTA